MGALRGPRLRRCLVDDATLRWVRFGLGAILAAIGLAGIFSISKSGSDKVSEE